MYCKDTKRGPDQGGPDIPGNLLFRRIDSGNYIRCMPLKKAKRNKFPCYICDFTEMSATNEAEVHLARVHLAMVFAVSVST
jgi:hypothetical protein